MKKLEFKTNINCGSCLQTVTPFLNKVESIDKWNVNTEDKNKILTVEGEKPDSKEVKKAVEDAGFEISKKGLFNF